MIKTVFWLNIPSPHQVDFLNMLESRDNVNLQVRYFDTLTENRKALGWSLSNNLSEFHQYIKDDNLNESLNELEGWQSSIHIIPGFSHPFLRKLLNVLIENNVQWIHWSEMSGKPLTKMLRYNYNLIKCIKPLFFLLNGYTSYAKKINKYGLGAFAIGKLAKDDFIQWGTKKNKIKYLYYSLPKLKKSSKSPFNFPSEKRIFMYAGSLTKHKGIDVLIKAFNKLKNSENWILVLVGRDNSNGEYKQMVKKMNLSQRVIFTGAIQNENMANYIGYADVFVLPTLFDGWGAVLNEAASLKKPLISTDRCGAAFHFIETEFNGFQVKAKSVNQLGNAMQYYIDNPLKIDLHGNVSYGLFKSFDLKSNVDLFIKNIKELCQRQK
ncbi:glycosyltransferase family 4 protein [Aureibaculum algae]|uniref:Glycosyltransferase family 4 protein n=1 Tax=Aureibaculum algae TaxID=2584122 RepID=A0A5B7TU22_9FLAO|nr:glycosyltransferase family 4 protein [Aureibaculum algae]QCX38821.1 glycosyltransferase family 4 protein [Aureibaculum algae]